jgi:hypothetical protein
MCGTAKKSTIRIFLMLDMVLLPVTASPHYACGFAASPLVQSGLSVLFSSFCPFQICIKKPKDRRRQFPSQRIFSYWGWNFNASVAHQDCGLQLSKNSGSFKGQLNCGHNSV